jgi:uncharacterized membrane protein YfcA
MSLLSLPVIAGVVLSVLIGVALGLLGGGGSILTVPILVYVIGVPAHEAIALSLLVVGTTSIAALIPHARGGRVRWKTGALFGATSMVGAYVAGKLAHHVPATVLLLLFGAMMLVTAIAMMRGRKEAAPEVDAQEGRLRDLGIPKIVLEGLAVGAVTGLVGAGGGFLVVPALVLLGKLSMRAAVGTSLLVIAMKSFAAFAGYVQTVPIDWSLGAVQTLAAVAGSFGGGALAGRVPQALLRRGFAWFVVVMAVFILFQEIPRALGMPIDLATAWPLVLGASAIPAVLAVIDLARRARADGTAPPDHGARQTCPEIPSST